ncbi:MAG TPA: type IV toxin-antitoxin system AbiEi family antitoxin domain-containing protein [Alphaproteobacteria bacterium]|nr:type IV toxin-antitoxin system AbiEi family antitoxin domain-containing protein [Alphaproteobacteria bacterium]HQS94660.1 type IV toxin-antitoxin system AbiEi family antitoxin domain-containing protein [Alphaproteobacteria bacterium]
MMLKKSLSSKQQIQALLTKTSGLVTLNDVQEALKVSRERASHTVWRLSKQGWLKKLRNGLYRVVSLESPDATLTDESPWLVANALFAPCYISGWTAAHFWGLTDQLFLKTWLVTTQPVHKKIQSISQHDFILRQAQKDYFFGLRPEWIENNKILISDPSKTLLDFLNFSEDYTAQTMIEVTQSYLRSDLKNIDLLSQYVQKVTNRSALKRLGFLLETFSPEAIPLIEFCSKNISKGFSPLSSQSICTKPIHRWNLKIPEHLRENH